MLDQTVIIMFCCWNYVGLSSVKRNWVFTERVSTSTKYLISELEETNTLGGSVCLDNLVQNDLKK